MRYYVVADPHGFYTPLKNALEEKGYFTDPEPHKLIICGDLFDRGMEAPMMQDFVLEEMAKDRIILVRGNHEDLLQDYVDNNCIPESHHIPPLMTKILPSMVNYYEAGNYIFVHGWIPCVENRYGYVKIPNWRTEAFEEEWYFARWMNGMDVWKSVKEEGKIIVCGHWHASYGHSVYEGNGPQNGPGADFTPFIADGIIALDACTALSGFVNCIVVEA